MSRARKAIGIALMAALAIGLFVLFVLVVVFDAVFGASLMRGVG